jgi:hypothetical protein
MISKSFTTPNKVFMSPLNNSTIKITTAISQIVSFFIFVFVSQARL